MDPKQLCCIEGKVVDAGGQPLADATVMIKDSDQSHQDIGLITDAKGGFRFQDLAPGQYTVAAYGPGGGSGTASIHVAPGRIGQVQIGVD